MADFLVIVILAAIIGLAAWYVYKEKKQGRKCIGCPDSCSCASKGSGKDCGGCCGCGK